VNNETAPLSDERLSAIRDRDASCSDLAVPRVYQDRRECLAQIDYLTRRAKELEADAARYRWLRDRYRMMSPRMDGQHHWAPRMSAILKGRSVDAAIDAALQLDGKEKQT
jgi:hypothetical protein